MREDRLNRSFAKPFPNFLHRDPHYWTLIIQEALHKRVYASLLYASNNLIRQHLAAALDGETRVSPSPCPKSRGSGGLIISRFPRLPLLARHGRQRALPQ